MSRLLGIDLGTTSFKAVVYDEHGATLSSSRVSPPDEQILVDGFRVTVWRPEKLWEVVCALVRRAVDALPDRAVEAVAIAELGLVGYPVDDSGNALYAGVTWIDPAAPTSRAFSGCGLDDGTLFSTTGNHLSPIYPPAWITWMAEHEPSYSCGMTRWLNVGDYVAYRLCGEMALDYSMASQTTMFDQRSLTLRADLLRSMGLDRNFVPGSQASRHAARRSSACRCRDDWPERRLAGGAGRGRLQLRCIRCRVPRCGRYSDRDRHLGNRSRVLGPAPTRARTEGERRHLRRARRP